MRERITNKRKLLFFGPVALFGLLLTVLTARTVYVSAREEAEDRFRTAAALYLDRVRTELNDGFVAVEDFQRFFFLTQRMNKQRFDQFIESYSGLRKNRTLVSLVLSAKGEADRLREFEAMRLLSGDSFSSWNHNGQVNRVLGAAEEAFYIRYKWRGDVGGGLADFPDLVGAEIGQYPDASALLKQVYRTGRADAALFAQRGDPIADQLGQFMIAGAFEIAPSIELFLLQSIDIPALVHDVEPVADNFVQYISLSKLSIPEEIANGQPAIITVAIGGAGASSEMDDIPYWLFEQNGQIGPSAWRFTAYADPDIFAIDYDNIFLTTLAGIGFTVLLTYMVWIQNQRSVRIAGIVERRTRALQEAHEELESHYRLLQKLNHEVIDARNAAEMANHAKSEFLATMSHELRTPLNAILGFSELIGDETLGPVGDKRYKEYAGDIHASGSHLLSIINDILDLAKLEAGKITIESMPLKIGSLGEHVVSLLNHLAKEKNIALCLDISEHMPPVIMGDELRLRQILINLASNAIKFTQKGSVTIRFLAKDFKNGRKGWVLEVHDTGIGIPEDKQSLLFDRFTQVDTALSRRHGGVGLGLAICRELVDRMEGVISVRSMQNVGTTIRAHLPLDESRNDDKDEAFI